MKRHIWGSERRGVDEEDDWWGMKRSSGRREEWPEKLQTVKEQKPSTVASRISIGEEGKRRRRGVARLLFFFNITHSHFAAVHTSHIRLLLHHPGEPWLLLRSSRVLDTAKLCLSRSTKHSAALLSFCVFNPFKLVSHFGEEAVQRGRGETL